MELNNEPNIPEPNAAPEGSATPNWFESLPDDVRSNDAFASWKDKTPADLLKSHSDLEGKVSKALIPPGENATPEEKSAFQKEVGKLLGVPENAEGYKLTFPEGFSVPADDPLLKAFLATAHAQGVTNGQAEALAATYLKGQADFHQSVRQANLEKLKAEWGNQYDENYALTVKGFKGMAGDAKLTMEEVESIADQLRFFPPMAKVFAVVGKLYSEDKFARADGGPPPEIPRTLSGNPELKYEEGFGQKK